MVTMQVNVSKLSKKKSCIACNAARFLYADSTFSRQVRFSNLACGLSVYYCNA